jgi:hypothetical protein
MPLQLDAGGGSVLKLNNPKFDEGAPAFLLSPRDGSEEVYLDYPSPFQEDVPYRDYLVYAFTKHDYSEGDIYELSLKSDGKRIGMVFPLQAAVSRDHEKADEVRFLRFAQGAFMALCNGLDMAHLRQPGSVQRSLSIFDFYSPNTIVVCIYKPQLADAANFRIQHYLASFLRYGYFLQEPTLDPSKIAPEARDQFEEPSNRISIEIMASEMREVAFITHLLQALLPYANTPLLRFFYLYQIVELMMGTLLEKSFTEFKTRLAATPAAASGIREVIEELQDQLSEKKRISKLFGQYMKPAIDLSDLRSSCNDFLKSLGNTFSTPEDQRGVNEFLYPVRNALFHNLRNVEPTNLAKLNEIAVAMRAAVCDSLVRFSVT